MQNYSSLLSCYFFVEELALYSSKMYCFFKFIVCLYTCPFSSLIYVLVPAVYSQLCQDLDASACSLLAAKPDFCATSPLSDSYCNRTCGKCGMFSSGKDELNKSYKEIKYCLLFRMRRRYSNLYTIVRSWSNAYTLHVIKTTFNLFVFCCYFL